MLERNDTNFKESLKEGKFLLMFYTDWCPLCPPIMDMLHELEEIKRGRFTFVAIDFDRNEAAAEHYGAFGVPFVAAVIDGRPVFGVAGLAVAEAYSMIIDELLDPLNNEDLAVTLAKINQYLDNLPHDGFMT